MSCEIDGIADVWSETAHVARKSHQCDACREPICPGDKYVAHFIIYDGDTERVKRCWRCDLIYQHLKTLPELIYEEQPDIRLQCGHEYKEQWGIDPPPEIAAMAFALPGDFR